MYRIKGVLIKSHNYNVNTLRKISLVYVGAFSAAVSKVFLPYTTIEVDYIEHWLPLVSNFGSSLVK
jgi:hypothetical protein